jgi:hypothetical protein
MGGQNIINIIPDGPGRPSVIMVARKQRDREEGSRDKKSNSKGTPSDPLPPPLVHSVMISSVS